MFAPLLAPTPLLPPSTPALQATDHAYAALEADRGMQLLLGACIDRSGAECLGLYSLDVESGMLVGGGVNAGVGGRECNVAGCQPFPYALPVSFVTEFLNLLPPLPPPAPRWQAFKSRCPMPQPGVQRIAGQNCLQVASLHSFGFALEGCVAASYFGGIAVWQVGTLGKLNRPQQPRAVWKVRAGGGAGGLVSG